MNLNAEDFLTSTQYELGNQKIYQHLLQGRGKRRKFVSLWLIPYTPTYRKQEEISVPKRFVVLCRLFSRHLTQPPDSSSQQAFSRALKHLGGALGGVYLRDTQRHWTEAVTGTVAVGSAVLTALGCNTRQEHVTGFYRFLP
jgi:hypothetical protein